MNVRLKEPVITMSLSQYEELREKANAADVKAGVIKQAIIVHYLSDFSMHWKNFGPEMETLYRQRASEFADAVLKRLNMD